MNMPITPTSLARASLALLTAALLTSAARAEDPISPRACVHDFLVAARAGDYASAAQRLDLSGIPEAGRARRGPQLALELKTVLDRKLWVDFDLLSSDPGGNTEDGLPGERDELGSIETRNGTVRILLQRSSTTDGVGVWRFASSTVARIPALYDEFGYGRLGELLPGFFFQEQFLEVQLWQWLGLIALILTAWIGSWIAARAVLALVRPLTLRSRTAIDDRLIEGAIGPLRLGLAAMIFSGSSYALGLSVPAQLVVNGSARTGVVVAVTWFALRAIDLISALVLSRMNESGQRAALQFVPLGRKTVKVAVVVLAALATLQSFGFDVTALIAGLGIGGLAVALALQKTLENLFGGATILADRPVRVGDFCRFGDKVGIVEEIGIRSTRIRTLDRTLVTVPNSEFAGMQLENFAPRDKIWYHPTIGLRYETTPEQLRYVLVEVRKMLYAHPMVDSDGARIRFTSFGAYSLDLEIFSYVKVTDFGEFLEVAEDLNLRVMDIVAAAGTGFAFPSSTTYLAQDEGVDRERASAAEAAVAAWRERGALFLPRFPDREIAELAGTLDYPPAGSPAKA
jgi:MscS family membrane protein